MRPMLQSQGAEVGQFQIRMCAVRYSQTVLGLCASEDPRDLRIPESGVCRQEPVRD